MSSDIYGTNPEPKESRRKHQAVSQRRDEYLQATGGEAVLRRRRHQHRRHRSYGLELALLGLGVLTLLIAGALWWRIKTP